MSVFRVHHTLRTLLPLASLLVLLALLGASCGGSNLTPPQQAVIEVWRTSDDDDVFSEVMEAYTTTYPHVSFEYRVLKEDEYIDELFSAWSKGEGPDIFSIPNWRMGEFKEFIAPMPAQVKLKRAYVEQSFGKKEQVVEERTVVLPTPAQMRDRFVDVVAADVVFDEQVYGMPLHMDTLGLFYNRDLMARAQVAVPPTNWEEFRNAVQAMVVLDDEAKVIQPAAAIGTSSNVGYYFDLVSVLMMQNGATMVTDRGSVAFASEGENGRFPGIEAIDFYTKFSDPTFKTYTWDDEQLQSLEAFTQGTLGFYFGYYRDLATIQKRSPNLNFSYTKLPQVDVNNPINYASYNVESVHIGSDVADHAWNFINFLTGEENSRAYTEKTGKISAVRALVGESQQDPVVGSFAQQALTAKSWYHGFDPEAALSAFAEMINATVAKDGTLEDIIGIAARKIRLTVEQE